MPIRMSGLITGMDTEGIVKELMSAQSLKKTKVEKAKTKLEWKQTKWSDLNKKLTNLYNNFVTKMQLSTAYKTKKANVSDDSKAKISASVSAVNGNYTMEVNNVATSQYLTGAVLNAKSGSAKLSDLDPDLVGEELTIKTASGTTKFAIDKNTTINDFTKALRNAGLNASYDTDQKRLFISSKETGLKNAFSITGSVGAFEKKSDLLNALDYTNMSQDNKRIVDRALTSLQTSGVGTDKYEAALDSLAQASFAHKNETATKAATTYVKAKLYDTKYQELTAAGTDAEQAEKEAAEWANKQIGEETSKQDINTYVFNGVSASDLSALGAEATAKYYPGGAVPSDAMQGVDQTTVRAALGTVASDYADASSQANIAAGGSKALKALGLTDIPDNIPLGADGKVDKTALGAPAGMELIAASDSEILLNGAKLTSSTSTVSANGLSIELVGKTKADEPVTFSVSNDVDGIYDSIKGFLKEYNEVMKEMNTLYNAESSKGYEPLTSEEKEAMTDEDVKLWEDKIKDSLLRNDDTLRGIMQGMRTAMMGTVSYNGRNYALSSFGIMTSTDYREGGLLHIYGDKDDSVYAGEDDKLKKAIEDNPEAVVATLTGIFGNLRKVMSDKMAGSKTSSALTFYEDIKMKDDLKQYEKDIKSWEDKLAEIEDSYYKKFTAMETAMAKLQSQQSSLSSLFGG